MRQGHQSTTATPPHLSFTGLATSTPAAVGTQCSGRERCWKRPEREEGALLGRTAATTVSGDLAAVLETRENTQLLGLA